MRMARRTLDPILRRVEGARPRASVLLRALQILGVACPRDPRRRSYRLQTYKMGVRPGSIWTRRFPADEEEEIVRNSAQVNFPRNCSYRVERFTTRRHTTGSRRFMANHRLRVAACICPTWHAGSRLLRPLEVDQDSTCDSPPCSPASRSSIRPPPTARCSDVPLAQPAIDDGATWPRSRSTRSRALLGRRGLLPLPRAAVVESLAA